MQKRRIAVEWIQTTSAYSKLKSCFDFDPPPKKGFSIALPECSHKEFMCRSYWAYILSNTLCHQLTE